MKQILEKSGESQGILSEEKSGNPAYAWSCVRMHGAFFAEKFYSARVIGVTGFSHFTFSMQVPECSEWFCKDNNKLRFIQNQFVPQLDRVATPQGKQGIWKSIFPDRENTGNLLKKYVFTQGIYHQHRENFES